MSQKNRCERGKRERKNEVKMKREMEIPPPPKKTTGKLESEKEKRE